MSIAAEIQGKLFKKKKRRSRVAIVIVWKARERRRTKEDKEVRENLME
jgi:hypothetical protein